jgi:predicted DNA-binding transcriptional regulator YafY
VKINKELESLVLSFGNDIEVLSPIYFKQQVANKIRLMNQKYLSDEENLHS